MAAVGLGSAGERRGDGGASGSAGYATVHGTRKALVRAVTHTALCCGAIYVEWVALDAALPRHATDERLNLMAVACVRWYRTNPLSGTDGAGAFVRHLSLQLKAYLPCSTVVQRSASELPRLGHALCPCAKP